VAGAFALLFMAYGAQYSFGVFFSAMLDEFHWSRASLAGAFSLYAFVYCGVASLAGRLTDRWGPRAVITIAAVFLGLGLAAMSGVRELWHPYVLYGVVAAVGMSGAYVPSSATVARWFVRKRGLAIGVASGGMALGTLVLPPLAHLLMSRIGWRGAYVVFGAGVLVCFVAVARVMRRDPESCGLLPDGETVPPPGGAVPARPAPWTVGRALRTRAFWMLFAIFTATWVPVFGPYVHLVPMARGFGISAFLAATLLSILGLAALGGRLSMGVLSDHTGRRMALAVGLALQIAAFAALAAAQSLGALYVAAFVFGFSYGGVSVMFPALVTDFFGREQAGGLVGTLFALAGCASAWGPLAVGFIYDRSGSYVLAWWLSAAFNALALAFLAFAHAPAPARRASLASSA
jgi:MFS family permease